MVPSHVARPCGPLLMCVVGLAEQASVSLPGTNLSIPLSALAGGAPLLLGDKPAAKDKPASPPPAGTTHTHTRSTGSSDAQPQPTPGRQV